MGGVAELLEEAQEAGLQVMPEGGRLRARGPRKAEPLAKKLLAHKREVLEHLQRQAVASMSLEDFKQGFAAVRVWSEALGRAVWFVSHARAAHELEVRGLYFTGEELVRLLKLNPTANDLKAIVEAKEAFGGTLAAVIENEQ